MAKEKIGFEVFLEDVDPSLRGFVGSLHEFFIGSGYDFDIKQAAKSFVLSYTDKKLKHTVMNYVFRKSGLIARLYTDNINGYMDVLQGLPDAIKKQITAAPVCKRLIDPGDCNPRCKKGFSFVLDGEFYQKCRYNAFMIPVTTDSMPFIQMAMENETKLKRAGA